MDKHMIHIDDLMRQRLGGGQEPERPGAWLNMRELLDKEMPTAIASGSNRRRIIGYFTGLLLLATASVGGYKLYLHSNTERSIAGGGGDEAERSVIAVTMPSNAHTPGKARPTNNNTTTSLTATSIASGNSSSASITSNPTNPSDNASVNNNLPSNNKNGVQQITASASHNMSGITAANTPTGAGRKADHTSASAPVKNEIAANNKVADANSGMHASQKQTTAPVLTADAASVSATNEVNLQTNRTSTRDAGMEQADFRILPLAASVSTSKQPARQLPVPTPVKYRYETIETIEIVYRRIYDASLQKTVFRIDTLPKGKVVVARPIPPTEVAVNEVPAKKEKSGGLLRRKKSPTAEASAPAIASSKSAAPEAPAAVVPAAKPAPSAQADPAASAESENLVSLSKFKVSSKHFDLWNADKINEAINKFKFNLARIQMYPGVMGGINASLFTPNSLGGFQVGLTSLLVLNDWWSLMTELKYIHRFNTGSSIRDDYKNVIPGSGSVTFVTIDNVEYKAYEWKDENVDHHFNYEVVQTVEMPLALRYSWGRTYAQGGLNLVYSKKIDAKEVTRPLGDVTSHRDVRPATHDDQPFITNDAPLVKIEDFGSRFGTGYVLGGGFMFTPAVYMDLRVAQTFWDNAKTTGAKQISKDLLRTPSIQLSVGYRFGQKH